MNKYRISFKYRELKAIGIPSQTICTVSAECALDAYELCYEELEELPIEHILITGLSNTTDKELIFGNGYIHPFYEKQLSETLRQLIAINKEDASNG